MQVWRITSPTYVDSAFSGIGAEVFGGRFNSPGHKVVYTAGSLALAVLELLVQVNKRERLRGYVCMSATFDDAAIETVPHVPEGWDARPYTRASQEIGDRWLKEQRSLVLRVPSVVIPQEYNYLINPLHPDFKDVEIGDAFAAPFDARLMQRMAF